MRSGYSSRILLMSRVPMPEPVPPPSECATWNPAQTRSTCHTFALFGWMQVKVQQVPLRRRQDSQPLVQCLAHPCDSTCASDCICLSTFHVLWQKDLWRGNYAALNDSVCSNLLRDRQRLSSTFMGDSVMERK